MSDLDLSEHPISMVQDWLPSLGGGWMASLSRYKYVPQQVEDHRELITVELEKLTPFWLEEQLLSLPEGFELAFHSEMKQGKRALHIPMIDFASTAIQPWVAVDWAARYLGITLRLFDSGRSLHGYGLEPISKSKWIRLMGLLLLANLPNEPPLTDARWVGHRLLAGYSALRWSHNSSHYLRMPVSLGT